MIRLIISLITRLIRLNVEPLLKLGERLTRKREMLTKEIDGEQIPSLE
jgi:hypothetical protein